MLTAAALPASPVGVHLDYLHREGRLVLTLVTVVTVGTVVPLVTVVTVGTVVPLVTVVTVGMGSSYSGESSGTAFLLPFSCEYICLPCTPPAGAPRSERRCQGHGSEAAS